MANRFWVGGTGTWNTTSTTNWSASSGGASGASVPTAADSVFFDQAATYTVTCTGALTCLDITVSAGTVTFAVGTSPTMAISGSMTLVAATVLGNIPFTFNATTTGKTITTNGASITSNVTFNGSGGYWTLGSALTMSGSRAITLTAGTLDTSSSNYSITVAGGGSSFTVNGGTLKLNGSTFTSASSSGGVGPWNVTSGTITAGTSQITLSGISPTTTSFVGGGNTYYNVSITNPSISSLTFTGTNTFNNLTLPGQSTVGVTPVIFSANQTINGTLTVSAGTNATTRNFFQSDVVGTTRTLTCAAVNLTDVDFQDITIAGAAAPATGTRLGNAAGNSGITFTSKTVYWNLAGAQQWTATGWATSSGGTPAVNNYPLPQDTAVFDNTGSVTGTITLGSAVGNVPTVDMSARTSAMTLATQANSLYGNWLNGTGTTLSGTAALTFANRGSQSITSNGVTFTQQLILNSLGGTLTLNDACTISRAVAGVFTLTNGTLNLNGKTLTLSATATATFLTAAGTKNITFNGGTLAIASSSATAFNNGSASGFTTTAGTGTGAISLTSASAKTFVGAGSTFNCNLNQGGAGTLTITGANTFNGVTNTYSATGATTITFPASTTTTVASFTAAGASGSLLTLNSGTAGTQATITLTGGGTVTAPDYLNVQDIAFTPAPTTNGSAPYKWYGGANSTNSGNNSGIAFVAGTRTAYILSTGSSWTTPADWNNSNNTIYLLGGGGGGAGSNTSGNNRAAGSGGGGGGFTKITNLTISGAITYAIGAGGTAGAAAGSGGAGGTTSWNSGAYTAGGGGGGTTTTTPTSTGGAGGTGSTFNGGAGGAGAVSTGATMANGGGGGGGAAGPNGAGGSGGTGFGSTTSSLNPAGGGGGGNGGGANGGNASSATGGVGGNNFNGVGGGSSGGAAGTFGGGGGGRAGNGVLGGAGGSGYDIENTIGGAGGAGAGTNVAQNNNTGLYGGGGAGAGNGTTGGTFAGGAGTQGVIFIVYTPSAGVTNNGRFFIFF